MCLPDIIGVNVTEPGSLALGAISQTLRCQNLLPRESLFRRQPHEETGEQTALAKLKGSGYSWDKVGTRGTWGKVTGDKKKARHSLFCSGAN